MKIFLLLIIVSLSIFIGGCDKNFQPRPEDEVVKLDQPAESPKGAERNHKKGDAVSLIKTDDSFEVEGWIEKKDADNGYVVRTGKNRLTKYETYPTAQIFPAPWANYSNLKVGDAVYNRNGSRQKGIIDYVPPDEYGNFGVDFGGRAIGQNVAVTNAFSSIETATAENLSPGDVVYFQGIYWAIVIGKRDGKIIIRQDKYPSEGDVMVDASHLQIFR